MAGRSTVKGRAMDLPRQAEMLANRVKKSFKRLRGPMEQQGIGAFRLYDRDIPEIRAVVDWYEGHLVVGEYTRTQTDAVPEWLETMGRAGGGAAAGAPHRGDHPEPPEA